jgi:3-dehydroquinate synthase
MKQLTIKTNSKTYPIFIGKDLYSKLGNVLEHQLDNITKVLIITDTQIGPIYLDKVKKALSNDIQLFQYIIPSGESYKSFDEYYKILTFALESGLDRKSAIIALGGGVIGDLSGFVAATYMRGIKFVQLPTTLLAHDSSVGGKVGINHPLGKNMIGAFYQPEAVIYDVGTLQTLSNREWRSGFAEVAKHGLISSSDLYHWLKESVNSTPITDDDLLAEIIKKAIQVKASIVEQDEKEAGIRAYLNFGHTLGHALEATLGYGTITHGEGVSIGMVFATKVSNEILNADLPVDEITGWFKQVSLPTEIPEQADITEIIKYMKRDKKSENGQINMVLLEQIGSPIMKAVGESYLEEALMQR